MKIKNLLALGGVIVFPIAAVKAQAEVNSYPQAAIKSSAQDLLLSQNTPITITNIELQTDNNTSQLLLKTDISGTITPLMMNEGNDLIIEIPSVQLSSNVLTFLTPSESDTNIEQVSISPLPTGGIKIVITGKNNPLGAQILNLEQGFAFEIQQEVQFTQTQPGDIEIIITGEGERQNNIVPQAQLQRQEALERPGLFLSDTVKQLPGVLMSGPPGEDKDVRLRGLDKEFTRLQIDGVTLPDAGEKREYQIGSFPSLFLDNVRVIRNSSAEFEADGIAGRVAVETIPIPKLGEPIFEGKIGYGGQDSLANGLFDSSVVYGQRLNDNFGFVGGLGYSRNPIDIEKIKTFSTGALETEEEFKDQTYKNILVKLGSFYDQGELIFQPYFFRSQELKDKAKININPAGTDIRVELEEEEKIKNNWGLAFSNKHRFNNAMSLDTQLGYYVSRETKDKFKENFRNENFDKREFELETKQDSIWNLTTALTIPIEGNIRQEIKVGGAVRSRDRFRDKTKTEINRQGQERDTTGPKDQYSLNENYFAGFVQNQVFLNDTLSILPGVRIEHVTLSSESGSNTEGSTGKSITDVLPSLHFLYEPQPELSFNVSLSRSLNRPKFDELSPFIDEKNDRFVLGNPDLDPARSWNLDIGGKYQQKYFTLGLNFFHKWINGVLEEEDTGETINGKDVFRVINIGDGFTNGVELEQKINFGFTGVKALEGLTLWANQTILNSQLTTPSGLTRRFKEQPNFISNLGLNYEYKPSGTQIAFYWNYVGESENVEPTGRVRTFEPISTLNLSLRQQLNKNFGIFFDVFNLTNAPAKVDMETNANGDFVSRKEEKAGRNYLFGFNWTF